MRIILVTLGSFGDIYPFIWMGKVLEKNGNEVIILANPYFEEAIRKEGFTFYPVGTIDDFNLASTPAVKTGNRFRDNGEGIKASRRLSDYMFLKPTKEIYSIISGLKNSEAIVINHFYAFGAKLAAEKHGIPNININLSTYWLKTFKEIKSFPAFVESKLIKATNKFIDKQLFIKPINELRAEIGIGSLKKSSIEWMFDGKNICLFPDWFLDFSLQEGLNISFAGFPEPKVENKSLPIEIIEFLKVYEKPVVFTPGTAAKDVGRFFSEAAIALERLNKPGIFLTKFAEAIPKKLPNKIIHVNFAPLELLLEYCGAIVHHGGIGTCYQALKSGIPQIICYRLGEQKENARVLKIMGVCEALSYKDVSNDLLFKHFKTLVSGNDVLLKCNKIKDKLDNISSEDNLITALKKYLSDTCELVQL